MERELLFSARKKDFKVEPFKSSGPGGQHRNKVETAIRITHIPTGLSAYASDSKSQSANKKAAFQKLVFLLTQNITQDINQRPDMPKDVVRTYSEKDDRVVDYASGKRFSYRQVVGKSCIDEPLKARREALRNEQSKRDLAACGRTLQVQRHKKE